MTRHAGRQPVPLADALGWHPVAGALAARAGGLGEAMASLIAAMPGGQGWPGREGMGASPREGAQFSGLSCAASSSG